MTHHELVNRVKSRCGRYQSLPRSVGDGGLQSVLGKKGVRRGLCRRSGPWDMLHMNMRACKWTKRGVAVVWEEGSTVSVVNPLALAVCNGTPRGWR